MGVPGEGPDDPSSFEELCELFWSLQSKLPPPFTKAVQDVRGTLLSLIFYKAVSDTYRGQLRKWTEEIGDEDLARDSDLYRFTVPQGHGWEELRAQEENVDRFLNESLRAIEDANRQRLAGISRVDYVREEALTDRLLNRLVEHLSQYDLSLERIRPNVLGRAFVDFAQVLTDKKRGNQPPETSETIARLMVRLVAPFEAGDRIYDPACGIGRLLMEVARHHREEQQEDPTHLFLAGQEVDPDRAALARMAIAISGFHGRIERGDSLRDPKFTEGKALSQFDCVLADLPPPGQKPLPDVQDDPFGRFDWTDDLPGQNGDTWAFLMHITSQLGEEGEAAVAVPRPALQEAEPGLRKELVTRNLLRAVIGLDSAVFEDVPTGKVLLLLREDDVEAAGGEILFYQTPDADYVQVERGRVGLRGKSAERIAEDVKRQAVEGDAGRVVPHDEIRRHDYALTPEAYHRD